jgi:hypothetical protein
MIIAIAKKRLLSKRSFFYIGISKIIKKKDLAQADSCAWFGEEMEKNADDRAE